MKRWGGIIPALAGSTLSQRPLPQSAQDHPRACGEHPGEIVDVPRSVGSSPRLRGAPLDARVHIVRYGIIPALAGSTREGAGGRGRGRDHPRACGEHLDRRRGGLGSLGSSPRLRGARRLPGRRDDHRGIIPALAGSTLILGPPARVVAGSSPRLRGARGAVGDAFRKHGIIPALAGSTGPPLRARRYSRDHPRACGEHLFEDYEGFVEKGSSPRLRGARRQREGKAHYIGIIPALAGSTSDLGTYHYAGRDHPRACGEHRSTRSSTRTPKGSSPRLRGARFHHLMGGRRGGIIPALAGSTTYRNRSAAQSRDHPRACGEHPTFGLSAIIPTGSSPRLRGAPYTGEITCNADGIIPALAGSTTTWACSRCATRDHPRACGEHEEASLMLARMQGSSPRLRGAPARSSRAQRPAGIIPALAGSTTLFFKICAGFWDHPRACGEHA